MFQTIQDDIYKLLDNLIINENNKQSRDMVINSISGMLNSQNYRNVTQFKVICDESNNFNIDDKFVFISVHIYISGSSCTTLMDFVITLDKLKMIRKLRKEKLKEIYK